MSASLLQPLPADVIGTHRVLAHVHTAGNSACSGKQTPADAITSAMKSGYDAILFTEHTGDPQFPLPVDVGSKAFRALLASREAADDAGLTMLYPALWGMETNVVFRDGKFSVDVTDDAIRALAPRYVIGSLHGDHTDYQDPAVALAAFRMLMENPLIDCIGHPTRWLPTHRIDWGEFFRIAVDTGTAVELNHNQWYKDTAQNTGHGKFDPGGQRKHIRLMTIGAEAGASFLYGSDVHEPAMMPLSHKSEGWETTAESIAAFNALIASCGIYTSRIINSDMAAFRRHLHLARY